MELGLNGSRVLVTGASGGIGSAVARAFAAEGSIVAVHYHRNRESAQQLAAQIGGIVAGADLRHAAEVDGLVSEVVSGLGGLDICVANAGVWPSEDTPAWDMTPQRWEETITANLTASFLTARAYLRHVANTGEGSLIFVASTAGQFGEAGHSDYAAAKAAIAYGLARSLKNEVVRVAPAARVNVVSPGWTVSPMTVGRLDQATVDHVTATMPLRKVATTDDIAAAVLFLASPVAAGHISGEVLTVAGGMEGRLLW